MGPLVESSTPSPTSTRQEQYRPAQSKSDAFFSASWCLSIPSNAPFTSSSGSSSLLVPPSPLLGRRASDSCLPPPCAGLTAGAPSASASAIASAGNTSFRGRLASTGNLNIDVNVNRPFQHNQYPYYQQHHPSLDRSRSCDPASPSSSSSSYSYRPAVVHTSRAPNTTELRLEEAVRRLQESQRKESNDSNNDEALDDEDDDEDDMYNDPEDAASTLKSRNLPFIPVFPLEPLAVIYLPQHRELLRPLKRALKILAKTQRIQAVREGHSRRKVEFAEEVEVMDVFAAVDYAERRGPPPIERLTMRDILELRQVKIELGVFGNNEPSLSSNDDHHETPSTPFEKMNLLESGPMSPSSSGLLPTSPFGFFASVSEEGADEKATGEGLDSNTTSTASSYESSTPSSVSLSTSTSSSSYYASTPSSSSASASSVPRYTHVSNASNSASVLFLDPHSSHLSRERETSPDSLLTSAFSSPSLSLSCSPSASESEYYYNESNDDDEEEDGDDEEEEPAFRSKDAEEASPGGEIGTERTPTKLHSRNASDAESGTTRPTSRSKNADYFRIPLPILSARPLPPSTTDIPCSPPSLEGPTSLDRAEKEIRDLSVEPIILLDRPWGLEEH